MKKERPQPGKAKSEASAPAKPKPAKTSRRAPVQKRGKVTLQDLFERRDRLMSAVQQLSAARLARVLADPDLDVNVQDSQGMTALHHAAARGARPCIRLLVATGKCNYLLPDKQGRYAFELALEWARDYAVARLLMKKQVQQAHKRGVPAYVPQGGAPR